LIKRMKGWVYVITNDAMPGLVKVGFTSGTSEARALQLNNTGAPHPYKVCYELYTNNPRRVERESHRALDGKREGKEWFRCSVEEAIVGIKLCAGDEVISENYTRSDQLKSDALTAAETTRSCIEASYRRSRDELNSQRRDREASIQKWFQAEEERIVGEPPLWPFCIVTTVIAYILLMSGRDNLTFGVTVLTVVFGWLGGALSRGYVIDYLQSRRRNSPSYKVKLGFLERQLSRNSEDFTIRIRRLESQRSSELRGVEALKDSALNEREDSALNEREDSALNEREDSALNERDVRVAKNEHETHKRVVVIEELSTVMKGYLPLASDREQPHRASCKACGQSIEIRCSLDYKPPRGVRWRCPTCSVMNRITG
jgi:hypothetical protein